MGKSRRNYTLAQFGFLNQSLWNTKKYRPTFSILYWFLNWQEVQLFAKNLDIQYTAGIMIENQIDCNFFFTILFIPPQIKIFKIALHTYIYTILISIVAIWHIPCIISIMISSATANEESILGKTLKKCLVKRLSEEAFDPSINIANMALCITLFELINSQFTNFITMLSFIVIITSNDKKKTSWWCSRSVYVM